MKLGYTFLLSLLCLFQNVQLSQSMNLFVGEDGEDSPLGAIVCYLIPCVDESLGWRNILAPVAVGPAEGQEQPEALAVFGIPQEQEEEVRTNMRSILNDLLQIALAPSGGGTRRLRGVVTQEAN